MIVDYDIYKDLLDPYLRAMQSYGFISDWYGSCAAGANVRVHIYHISIESVREFYAEGRR